jgi:hypothetical protein
MTAITTASDALARLDDGVALPGDPVLAELFDRHCRWEAQRFCLVCGLPGGPECDSCHVEHDKTVEASTDV